MRDTGSPNETLWKVIEVAEFLRLTDRAIYNLVGDAAIPHVRIGTRLRFVPRDIKAWVESQSTRHELDSQGLVETR